MASAVIPTQTAQASTLTVPCSVPALVAAINTANSAASAHTLNLAGRCTYTLVVPNNAANGLPVLTSDITVNGNSATITRDPSASSFRILAVASTGTLTLNDTTISGGLADTDCPGQPGGISCGAGIDNRGTLTVNNSRVINNTARGSTGTIGVEGGGIDNDGTATLTGTDLSGNTASYTGTASPGEVGGAIANDGSLTIDNSRVTHNTASDTSGTSSFVEGAGVESFGSATVKNSIISDNLDIAPGGFAHGALINQGTMTVTNTLVTRNTVTGGVVAAAGVGSGPFSTLTMTRVVVSRNTASAPGGLARGGGLGMREANATLTASVFSDNTTSAPGGTARGGGIFGEGTIMTLASSEVTRNTASGAIAQGGGLFNQNTSRRSGTATLGDSEVTGNTASGTTSAAGGGIFNANTTSGSVTLNDSTVAENTPNDCTPPIGTCT
jgi:hypothetical protein